MSSQRFARVAACVCIGVPIVAGLIVISRHAGAAAVAAPVAQAGGEQQQAPPQSADARAAAMAYERAVRTAKGNYRQALKAAMDKALTAKNLDEANRIKAVVATIEKDDTPPSGRKPQRGRADATKAIAGVTWRRFGLGDGSHGVALMRFQPDGTVDGEHTGYTNWTIDGDRLQLSKKNASATGDYVLVPNVTLLAEPGAPGGKGTTFLVPDVVLVK